MTQEFKGSTSPWYIDNDTNQLVITNSDETKAVAFIPKRSDNAKADSVLIKHAPEMLDFIREIFEDYEKGLIDDVEHIAIRAEQLYNKATTI